MHLQVVQLSGSTREAVSLQGCAQCAANEHERALVSYDVSTAIALELTEHATIWWRFAAISVALADEVIACARGAETYHRYFPLAVAASNRSVR